jgi:acyl dehydratase
MPAGQVQSRAPDDALLHTVNPAARALIGVRKTRQCYVSARDIARFAQAIGADDPVHFDEQYARGTRHGGIVAPALFCQSLTYEDVPTQQLPADGSPLELNVPIPAQRTVGGGSEYQIFRLVRAAETLTITTELKDIQIKQGKSGILYLLAVQTDFADADGKPVASELATYIKRI